MFDTDTPSKGTEDQFCCWMNDTGIVIILQDCHCEARTL